MDTYIIDTHALVWYLDKDNRLSEKAERILDNPHVSLIIPTVVLAEAKYLFRKRKIKISFKLIMEAVENDHRCVIYPFDISCVENLDVSLDLHDGVIVATGVIYRNSVDSSTKVVTKDTSIRNSGIIDTVW